MDVPAASPQEGGDQSPTSFREQDRFLPTANISRIMKKGIPQNGKIGKDAKEMVQEAVSEFISFITSEASDRCVKEKRKTVNGDDLLWAMATLGFGDYINPLKIYLARYRETVQIEGDNKGSAKGAARKIGDDHGMAHQSSYSQGVNYGTLQPQSQQMIAYMQGLE